LFALPPGKENGALAAFCWASTVRVSVSNSVKPAMNFEASGEMDRTFDTKLKVLARKIVAESLEEHTIVKKLIKELGGLSGRDESFQAKATVLKEAVEHHADEEEKDLFPVAEDELGEERLHDLGAEMEALKARLLRAGGAASSMGRKQTTRSTRSRARRRTSSRARMSG